MAQRKDIDTLEGDYNYSHQLFDPQMSQFDVDFKTHVPGAGSKIETGFHDFSNSSENYNTGMFSSGMMMPDLNFSSSKSRGKASKASFAMSQGSEIGDGGSTLRSRLDSIRDMSEKSRDVQKLLRARTISESNSNFSELSAEQSELSEAGKRSKAQLLKMQQKQQKLENFNKQKG